MQIRAEFDFTLEQPIEYSVGGEMRQGSLLVLKAPSNKVRNQRTVLKEAFMLALADIQASAQAATESKEQGSISEADFAEYVMHILYSSKSVRMVEMIEQFKLLLCSQGICKVENEADFTSVLFDRMDADDADRLMGAYLANFILASFYRNHLKR